MEGTDISVEFHPTGKIVRVEHGMALLRALAIAEIDLRLPCGGKGRCGKCKVIFEEGASPPTPTEREKLTETELVQGYRLGCQTAVCGSAVVYLPDSRQGARILTAGAAREVPLRPGITKRHVRVPKPTVDDLRSDLKRALHALDIKSNQAHLDLAFLRRLSSQLREADFSITAVLAEEEVIAFEPGDTSSECYGAAFDIGTTTVAAYLLELNSGNQMSVAAAMNPQAQVGDDVISRITYLMQRPDGLDTLRTVIIEEMNNLLKILADGAGISLDRVYEATVVGNTCMLHLLLGVDPSHLALSPYVPVVSQSLHLPARDLGLGINEFGRVYTLPSIAGFVGADMIGVVLATGLYQEDPLTLAVDIGTNGEIVLGSKDRMIACSTAAGPAFEGAHIKNGMRAAPGAIDAVWLDDGQLCFSTVGGAKAAGICGSGLLDAIVCLVQAGIIEKNGRIVDVGEVSPEFSLLSKRLRSGEQGNEFILATAEESQDRSPIELTQRDIREVQLAKGAIAAGIRTLMDRMGVGVGDIDRVVLAGAFGNYVSKESAVKVGMLPNIPLEKVHAVGNSAGEGAKLALISLDARADADCIADRVEYVELTTEPGFQGSFADSLMF